MFSLIAGTVLSLALLLVFVVFGIGVSGKLRVVLGVVFGVAFVVCAKYTEWCVYAYRSFSYDGERKLSKQIVDGTAEAYHTPGGWRGAGHRLRQRCAYHCLRKAQSSGKWSALTAGGKGIRLLQSAAVRKKNAAAEGG